MQARPVRHWRCLALQHGQWHTGHAVHLERTLNALAIGWRNTGGRVRVDTREGVYRLHFSASFQEIDDQSGSRPTGRLAHVSGWICEAEAYESDPESCLYDDFRVVQHTPTVDRGNVNPQHPALTVVFSEPADPRSLAQNFQLYTVTSAGSREVVEGSWTQSAEVGEWREEAARLAAALSMPGGLACSAGNTIGTSVDAVPRPALDREADPHEYRFVPAAPLRSGTMVWTEPFPKESVPTTSARLWSCNAPATISEADAEPPLISTTIGRFGTSSPRRLDALHHQLEVMDHRLHVGHQVGLAGQDHARIVHIDRSARQPRDRLIEEAAGVVAKVEQDALEVVADLLLELVHRLLQAFLGLLAEGGDADVAEIALATPAHGLDPDDVTRHLDVERRLILAADREPERSRFAGL